MALDKIKLAIQIAEQAGVNVVLTPSEAAILLEENAKLRKRVAELEALSRKALNALVWCGGSNDFAPDGKARQGWGNVVVPVFDDARQLLSQDYGKVE